MRVGQGQHPEVRVHDVRDKDGLVPAAPTGSVDPTEPYQELVRILDGVVTSGIDGRLGPGGTILGRVVDAGGRPLAKVCVEAPRYDVNWSASTPVTTDKDGLYAIKGVLPHDLGAAGQEYSVLVLFTDCSKATRFPPTYFPEPVSFQTPRENVSLADFTPGTDPTSGTNPASCVLPRTARTAPRRGRRRRRSASRTTERCGCDRCTGSTTRASASSTRCSRRVRATPRAPF